MPKLLNLVLILFAFVFFTACASKSIVGEWRSDQGVTNPDPKNGLFLTIRADSTLTMDIQPNDSTSQIPGWHVGGKQNGTWKNLDSNKVEFIIVNSTYKYPFVYKIAKLSDDSLILQSPLEFFLKFKRVE